MQKRYVAASSCFAQKYPESESSTLVIFKEALVLSTLAPETGNDNDNYMNGRLYNRNSVDSNVFRALPETPHFYDLKGSDSATLIEGKGGSDIISGGGGNDLFNASNDVCYETRIERKAA